MVKFAQSPHFKQRIVELFPEIVAQELYLPFHALEHCPLRIPFPQQGVKAAYSLQDCIA